MLTSERVGLEATGGGSDHNVSGYLVPPFWDRVWGRLGFGRRVPVDFEDGVHGEVTTWAGGYFEGYCTVDVYTRLDWRDRLRVLVSGWLTTRVHIQTDVEVRRMRSMAASGVLRPGFRFDRG